MIIRTQAPATFSPEFKSIPKPGATELNNGVKLYSYNLGSQPVFKLELIFSTGSADTNNPSLASMVCNLLREGTKSKSAEELNNLLDYYGSFLDIKSGLDYSTLTLFGRAEFIDELLPVISEILQEPAFLPDSVVKQRKLAIQNLQISQKKTSYWSPRLLRRNIFGEAHAYSRIPSTEEVESITTPDLHDFHRQLVGSLDSILLSGSFNQTSTERLLNQYFGVIETLPKDVKLIDPVFKAATITKKLEQTSQASIALGSPTLGPDDENYPSHSFVVKLLGGYFGSRLMKTLREDKGLTYGVHAYFVQLRQGNFMQIAADVKLEAVDESVDIVGEEISRLLKEPVDRDELETVKNYMLGEYVNDTNTAFDFAGLYKKILVQQLPDNYFDRYYGKIARLSVDEVELIKLQVLIPESFTTVKVY